MVKLTTDHKQLAQLPPTNVTKASLLLGRALECVRTTPSGVTAYPLAQVGSHVCTKDNIMFMFTDLVLCFGTGRIESRDMYS